MEHTWCLLLLLEPERKITLALAFSLARYELTSGSYSLMILWTFAFLFYDLLFFNLFTCFKRFTLFNSFTDITWLVSATGCAHTWRAIETGTAHYGG